jgi:hypothetical protein
MREDSPRRSLRPNEWMEFPTFVKQCRCHDDPGPGQAYKLLWHIGLGRL